ncbi:MAG TPA: cyclic nucleotide-binding domain-containing protein [Candidatus Limnocylindrales bacterium]|nr:cyclic nucleotide-binding domain-containing protein [Candidatus Limnocylindrales bacterium]
MTRPSGSVRAVLRNGGILRIELAWATLCAGDLAFLVALLLVSFESGGAVAAGLLAVARSLPAVFVAPVAGLFASRSHPARLLRVVHAGRTLTAVALTIWIAIGGPFAGLLVLVVIAGLVGSLARPLTLAALPSFARDPGELVAGNVVMSTGEGIGSFLGPLVAGVAVAVSGPTAAAAIATATLAVGAIAVLTLRVGGDVAAEVAAQERSAGSARPASFAATFRAAVVAGPAALRRAPGAAAVTAGFNAQFMVRSIMTTLAVVASFELLSLGEAGVGLLGAAFGLGSLLGALGGTGLAGRSKLGPWFAVALSLWGLPYAVMGGFPVVIVAVTAFLVSGAANGILDVAGFTLLQRSVPTAARVPVLGFLEATLGLSGAIGGVLAPILVGTFGNREALAITGALLPVLALVTWPLIKRVDDEAMIPDDELRLMRGIPLFAPLPMTALERIAGALTPTAHAAGETIFREGDQGDRYYIIATGEVEVMHGDREINRLGAGEGIGEIALLNSVPRTATVTALTATDGYELCAPDFLAAIAGPTSMAAATLVANERLERSAASAQ